MPTCASQALAADSFDIGGSFRTRVEAIDGQFRPNAASDDEILLLRTTVAAEYRHDAWAVGAELMDSRAYFQEPDSSAATTEVNALELVQAYVRHDFGDRSSGGSIKVGRMTRDIGSRRLVARAAYRNTTNAFTGVTVDLRRRNGDSLVAFWLLPHARLPDERDKVEDNEVEWDRESLDLQFFGASYTMRNVAGGSLEVYGYGLVERDDPEFATRNRRLFTPGFRLYRAPAAGKTDYEIEAVYQTGQTRGSTRSDDRRDLDVSAWFIHAEAGQSFGGGWQPRISVMYDYATGDKRGAGNFNRFDTLFGARRFEYGPSSLFGAVNRANLVSPGARIELKPSKAIDAMFAYRALWLDSSTDSFGSTGVRDATGASGHFAGHQIEGRLRAWIVPKKLRLDIGFAWLGKGSFLTDASNASRGENTRYGYGELTFSF